MWDIWWEGEERDHLGGWSIWYRRGEKGIIKLNGYAWWEERKRGQEKCIKSIINLFIV